MVNRIILLSLWLYCQSLIMQDENLFFADNTEDFIERFNSGSFSSVFILTDSNCSRYCLPVFRSKYPQIQIDEVIEIQGGEDHKNMISLEMIWSKMGSKSDRYSVLINLGGGIITDMGSFAAAVYKRGISFINVPTSLLAMTDAAIGGKTGVNFNGIKNQIGSFSEAFATLIDFDFLNTLPDRELKSGFAEMLKIAAIASSELFCQLSEVVNIREELDAVMIRGAIFTKLEIVADDPLEKGRRKLLNFGHTIGHAIESLSIQRDAVPLSHGEAVAHGMVCESLMAVNRNLLQQDDHDKIKDIIFRFFGNYSPDENRINELVNLMRFDKKNRNGKINFTLPVAIGDGIYDQYAEPEEIRKILNTFI